MYYRRQSVKTIVVIVIALAALSALGVLAKDWFNRSRTSNNSNVSTNKKAPKKPASNNGDDMYRRLSLQKDADRQRRRLGKRFSMAGREQSVEDGILTVDGQSRGIRIIRRRDSDTERVAVAFENNNNALSWNSVTGALSAGRKANDHDQKILDRLVMDSPDQFILAQLRGANYYTIGRGVRPEEAGGDDNYKGPLWDIVKVTEPTDDNSPSDATHWRLFYINSSTGMIEKIVSREDGDTITALISGWTDQNGEKLPTHITWKRNDQIVMDLNLHAVNHGPKQ